MLYGLFWTRDEIHTQGVATPTHHGMPLPKVLLRRKLWLGVAVFLFLTCLYVYWPSELVRAYRKRFVQLNKNIIICPHVCTWPQVHESERVHIPPVPTFDWVAIENVTSLVKCRNSVQGPQLIADELGNNTLNTSYWYDNHWVNMHARVCVSVWSSTDVRVL